MLSVAFFGLFDNKNKKTAKSSEDRRTVMPANIASILAIVGIPLAYLYVWIGHQTLATPTVSNEFFAIGLVGIFIVIGSTIFGVLLFRLTASVREIDTQLRLNGIADSKSPRKLTEKGKSLSKLIDGEKLAQKYISKISMRETDSPYAIQKACFDFARDKLFRLLPPDEVSYFENIAYQEGSDVRTLCLIVGLEMRDLILKEHKKSKNHADA